MIAASSPPNMFTLVFLTALSVLSLNMFLPSLSNMAEEFRVDYSLMALSIAGYLGVTAALMLIMGPLSDRLGRRPVLLLALTVFTFASLVCALSTNIWLFLGFRVLQGAIIAGWALSLAVIRDMLPPRQAASKIGYVTMAMGVAPMLGPMFGGALDELLGWRANFAVFALFGAAALGLCWVDLGETNKTASDNFARQIEAYPALLRSRRFWGYALCMAFATGSFYTFLAGVPLVAVTTLELSPAALGLYMGSITAGFTLGSYLSGRFAARYPLTTTIICGRIVACTGLIVGLALTLTGSVNVPTLFGAVVFVGIGNGLTIPGCNVGAMSARPKLAGSAAGLAGALTVGGGAVLTTFTGAVLTPENGAYTLQGIMLSCALLALAAALYVRHIDRLEKRERPDLSVHRDSVIR